MFIAPRDDEVIEARASAAPGTSCSRSATPPRLPRWCSALLAHRAVRGHHPRLRVARAAWRSTGPTTRGMTSPAFSMITGVAVADVLAREVVRVVQRRQRDGGPGHAARARARQTAWPRRCARCSPRSCSSVVVACCAGYLKAVAQRGNFEVVPRRARRARSFSLMTTPSVSKGSVCRLLAPLLAEREHRVDAVASAPVRLHRTAPRAQRLQHRGMGGSFCSVFRGYRCQAPTTT